jgi:Ser/Thr protein kinase RdoA (MazF antagonist)
MTPPRLDEARSLVERIGMGLSVVGACGGGETGTAHVVRDGDGREWVLKWADAGPSAEGDLARLVRLVDGLRADGYPAPEHLVVGVTGSVAYWVQSQMPGAPVQHAGGALDRLVPELVGLADRHAGRGDLADPPWPGWLLRTLDVGGDGYCLHETMLRQPSTARMLERIRHVADVCRDAPVARQDIVHFDFSYANVLTDGTTITGVVDWNVPFPGALQGDRAFDIATLLFYAYDRPRTRARLRAALLDRCDPRAAALYLAHLTLRQVEWSTRHHPSTPTHARFLTLGQTVLADLDPLLP